MKYCSKCGAEIAEEAVICPKCGCAVEGKRLPNDKNVEPGQLSKIAFVFMIIGTIIMAGFGFLIPLAWCLPMTLTYNRQIKTGQSVSLAFKICSLLFVSAIAGILMLCEKDSGEVNA